MDALSNWLAEIESSIGRLGALRLNPVSANERLEIWNKGFPALLPLWRRGKIIVSLRASPEGPPVQWQGVIENRGQALTLSATPATLVPRYLFSRYLSNNPEGSEFLKAEWAGVRDALGELHETLGGKMSSLEPIHAAISDESLIAALEFDEGRRLEFEAAHSRVARQIDTSTQFQRYADWLDQTIEGKFEPQAPLSDYGRWKDQLLARFAELAASSGVDTSAYNAAFADLLEEAGGLDTSVPNIPTWETQPGSGSGEALQVSMAVRLQPDDLPQDPITAGVARALRARRMDYDGETHAEAVVARDEGGEPERAWRDLQAAAWWMARSTGKTLPPIRDGAHLLCERHNWKDVGWVVDHLLAGEQ